MVPISTAGMKNLWINSLHVMLSLKVFDTQDGRLAEHNSLHRSIRASLNTKTSGNILIHFYIALVGKD